MEAAEKAEREQRDAALKELETAKQLEASKLEVAAGEQSTRPADASKGQEGHAQQTEPLVEVAGEELGDALAVQGLASCSPASARPPLR